MIAPRIVGSQFKSGPVAITGQGLDLVRFSSLR